MKVFSGVNPKAIDNMSYMVYCGFLNSMIDTNARLASVDETSGIFDFLKGSASGLKEFLSKFGDDLVKLSKDKGILLKDLVKAFANKGIFKLLKGIRFDLSKLLKSIMSAMALINKGLLGIFRELENTGLIAKLRKGIVKIDDLLNKYPLLKKVAGVALAGLLLYMWMSMSFVGDVSYDFDTSDILDALSGKFDLADLFLSAGGMRDLFVFVVGATTGISFTYLLADKASLLVALAYTALKRSDFALAKKIAKSVKFITLKI